MLANAHKQPQTTVDIWHWAMYHNPANFTEPETFSPDRWLGDPHFVGDRRAAFEPFSTGKRSCIGQRYVKCCAHLGNITITRLGWLQRLLAN